MSIKICEVCGQKYSTDTNSSCPYCDLMNDNQCLEELKKLEKETEEYKKDTTFRIENNPGEIESLKYDINLLFVGIFILAILLFLLLPLYLFLGSFIFTNPFDSTLFYIILTIFGSAEFYGMIYLIIRLRKTKYLMKKGIILKNIRFTATNDFPTAERPRPLFLKARANYVAENGIEYEYKGRIQTALLKNEDVCDVLVDPNNYKKYIMKISF